MQHQAILLRYAGHECGPCREQQVRLGGTKNIPGAFGVQLNANQIWRESGARLFFQREKDRCLSGRDLLSRRARFACVILFGLEQIELPLRKLDVSEWFR